MNRQEKIIFKNKLKQFCSYLIEQRIKSAKAAIDNAQQAANSEEKSSAGDKYETGRAMSHLERDMHTKQVAENIKEIAMLQAIHTDIIYDTIVTGAFIKCTGMSFFIAAGLGKQIIDGEIILFLSPNAPLAKLMQNKKTGDHFLFAGKDCAIAEVF
jgi:hypothetical protein